MGQASDQGEGQVCVWCVCTCVRALGRSRWAASVCKPSCLQLAYSFSPLTPDSRGGQASPPPFGGQVRFQLIGKALGHVLALVTWGQRPQLSFLLQSGCRPSTWEAEIKNA